MEELKIKLHELVSQELASLAMGHSYDVNNILRMKRICRLLYYYKYVDIRSDDLLTIVKPYD